MMTLVKCTRDRVKRNKANFVDDKTSFKNFHLLHWSLQAHMPSGGLLSGFETPPVAKDGQCETLKQQQQ